MTEDGVSTLDCLKTQSAEQCGSQQVIYFRCVSSFSQAMAQVKLATYQAFTQKLMSGCFMVITLMLP